MAAGISQDPNQNAGCFLVFALMYSRRLGVASLGRALPAKTAEKHRIKRVDRFLGNNRIPTEELAKALARTIIGPRKVVLVAIDWTDLQDGKHQVLAARISTAKGRALPIDWRVVPKEKLTLNKNRIECERRAVLEDHCLVWLEDGSRRIL